MNAAFNSLRRRPARLLIAVLLLALAGALALRFGFEARRRAEPSPTIGYVRRQLRLEGVLDLEAAVRARPEDQDARLRLADACERTGDPAGAALALYPLLEGAPSPELTGRYVGHCISLAWFEEAEPALRRLEPPPAPLVLRLADAFVKHGQAERAVPWLRTLESQSLGADEWLEGAVILATGRQYDPAIDWARRGADAAGNPAARIVLARCYLMAGRPAAALDAVPQLTLAGAPDARVQLWRARAELRSLDAAVRKAGLERMDAVLRDDPRNAVAAFEAGRAHLEAGNAARAEPLLEQAGQAQYQEILCYPLLARAYRARGRETDALVAEARYQMARGFVREAQATLARALERDPQNLAAQLDLTAAFFADMRLPQALQAAQRAEKLAQGSFTVRLLQGQILQQLDRVPESREKFEQAAAADPARAHEAFLKLGSFYFESQQYEPAIEVLERAVRARDTDAQAQLALGRAYARRMESPAAAEKAAYHLVRAGALRPNYYLPWLTAGSALQRLGALPEAAACYRRSMDGESESDGAYVQLARLLQLQRRSRERMLVLRLYQARSGYDLERSKLEHDADNARRNAKVQIAYGDLLTRSARTPSAFPYLLRATALRPNWEKARARLADACALLEYDDLRAEMERAPH